MSKIEEGIMMSGIIEECLPGTKFMVRLENNHIAIGHVSGKMRMNNIRVLMGDKVKVSLSAYDLTKCRIDFREK